MFHTRTLELMADEVPNDVKDHCNDRSNQCNELEQELMITNEIIKQLMKELSEMKLDKKVSTNKRSKPDPDETTDKGWSKVDEVNSKVNDLKVSKVLLLNLEGKNDLKDHGKITRMTWLGDTGASCHLTNSNEGTFDVEVIKSPVKIGSSKTMTATKLKKKQMTVIQKDGSTQDFMLTDVNFVRELWVNLFSIGKALQNGFNIGNKKIRIFLVKGNTKLTFNRIMPMSKGFVVGVEMLPSTRSKGNGKVAIMALDKGKTAKMNDLHKLLTHVGKDSTRKMAKFYG